MLEISHLKWWKISVIVTTTGEQFNVAIFSKKMKGSLILECWKLSQTIFSLVHWKHLFTRLQWLFLVKLHTEHADLQGCWYVCWSCHTHIRQTFFRLKVTRETLDLHLSRSGGGLFTGTQSTYDSQIHCACFRDYFHYYFSNLQSLSTLFIKISP